MEQTHYTNSKLFKISIKLYLIKVIYVLCMCLGIYMQGKIWGQGSIYGSQLSLVTVTQILRTTAIICFLLSHLIDKIWN